MSKDKGSPITRCLACLKGELVQVSSVPDPTKKTATIYWRCNVCDQVKIQEVRIWPTGSKRAAKPK